MNIRQRRLPPGWYPGTGDECLNEISGFERDTNREGTSLAVIAPHAGWAFSGGIAFRALSSLVPDPDTVIVFGGHCLGSSLPLVLMEDGFETPLGLLRADTELRNAFVKAMATMPDGSADNTLEIQLPFVKYLFPSASVLCVRAPSIVSSFALGETISGLARDLGRKAVAVGSTDLTHYGPNYGFSPAGSGAAAREWARENDKTFLDAVLAFDAETAITAAVERGAACSSGAVVAAMGFACAMGANRAELKEYGSSADVISSSSFVGYGAVSFYP